MNSFKDLLTERDRDWRETISFWPVVALCLIIAVGFFFIIMQRSGDPILVWLRRDLSAVIIMLLLLIALIILGIWTKSRAWRFCAGAGLILYAAAAFVSTSFFITNIKPWLVGFMLAGAVGGVWLIGDSIIRKSGIDVDLVRREGPGSSPPCVKRTRWITVQTTRANWLALTIVSTLLLSLALYIANHVQVVDVYPPFRWQSHLAASNYVTEPDDSLLAAAANLDVDVRQLAAANPTVAVQTDAVLTSTQTLNQRILPTGPGGRSLDVIARDLGVTPEEVALGFATIDVMPNQVLEIPTSGPRLWIDWILWGLVGVCAYLLIDAARYYREIPHGKGNFVDETPWYFTQLITGPLIAFVALAILTRIDFSVLGQTEDAAVSVNLSQLPYDVMFGLAFLLGFFSRVARKLLELITESIFRPAWSAAEGAFDILIKGEPDERTIKSDARVVFTTEPLLTNVQWKVTQGALDGATYHAPQVEEESISVVVSAFANDGSHRQAARAFEIVPHKYEIEVDGDPVIRADRETSLHFVAETTQLSEDEQKEIYWHWKPKHPALRIAPDYFGKDVGLQITEPPEEQQEVDIIASFRGHAAFKHLVIPKCSLDSIEATLVNGDDGKDKPLSPSSIVAPGSKIKLHAVGNLPNDHAQKIAWTIQSGDNSLKLNTATGETVFGEILISSDVNDIVLIAELPDSDLASTPPYRLIVRADAA